MSKWMTIAPIRPFDSLGSLGSDLNIDLGGVKIISFPDEFRDMPGFNFLSVTQRNQLKEAETIFIVEYEAKSLGDPDVDWKGMNSRSKQSRASELINLCNLALWIAKPTGITASLYLHIEKTECGWNMREANNTFYLRPHNKYSSEKYHSKDLILAKELNPKMSLIQRDNNLWLAICSTSQALSSPYWEMRYTLLWIVLESLFGSAFEISHKISERIAFFISKNRNEAKEIFNKAKKAYSLRSTIVHGRDPAKHRKQSDELLYDTELFVRESLLKIILDKEVCRVLSNEKSRESYLDELPFNRLYSNEKSTAAHVI